MTNTCSNTNKSLRDLKNTYPENLIFSYLNINSVCNKFKSLEVFLNGSVDVLTIAETKLDSSFPSLQFLMEGYKRPFRLDITDKSGGLLVYIRSDIPARQLHVFEISQNFQLIRNPKSN